MKKDTLCVQPHNPLWVTGFEKEKRRILEGANLESISIEYVGSTSIASVCAKPILDLALLCSETDLSALVSALKRLGYDYRGEYGKDLKHYYAVFDHSGIRFCQAHIYTAKTADWAGKLKFRDVLSVDQHLAKEYSCYKLGLVKKGMTKGEYADIKSAWLDLFWKRVKASKYA